MTRNMPMSRATAASPLSRGGIVAPLSMIPTRGRCGVSLDSVWFSQKRAEKRPCIQRLKAREIKYIFPVARTLMALESDRGALTHRVTFGDVWLMGRSNTPRSVSLNGRGAMHPPAP
jgi:hypothetical protein